MTLDIWVLALGQAQQYDGCKVDYQGTVCYTSDNVCRDLQN